MIPALSLSPGVAFALGTAAKATLVLLAAGAAAAVVALRGGSAAARHLVWTLGVCGALAIPLLSAALPGWRTHLVTVRAPEPASPATFAGDPILARPSAEQAAAASPSAGTPGVADAQAISAAPILPNAGTGPSALTASTESQGSASIAQAASTGAPSRTASAQAPSTGNQAPSAGATSPAANAQGPSTDNQAFSAQAPSSAASAQGPSTDTHAQSAPAPSLAANAQGPSTEYETPSPESGDRGVPLGAAVLAIYLAGVMAVLGRMALGRWGVARLARRASPVADPSWAALAADLAWLMDVRRPIRILRSPEATMPMTWGIMNPTVLLPAEAEAWPEERRRVVLLHELAHVARHDCLTQTLATAACALYWFNPAAWLAARRLRVERELACDDRVLAAGTRARDYANHLLEVARAFRPARLAGAVAVSMARPSQLEGRLLAVLDGVRNRGMLSRPAAAFAAGLALALVLPLAALQPAQAQGEVPAGVRFGGPKPWKDGAKPPRSPDAYPDLDAAMRRGMTDVAIPARPGERLTLRLPEGVSARVLAWDRPSVHVRVDDRGLRVDARRSPGGVTVTVTGRPQGDAGNEPHVRIMAPRDFDVDTHADGGGIEIGALNGTFTGSVAGGGLAFNGTRGTVRMTARGGGAVVNDGHLDGRLVMDGGAALLRGNSGNLDVVGAAATAHGRPGGPLSVDVPGQAGADDDEVACTADGDCTIAAARGQGARTSVSAGRGQGATTVWTARAGRPARAATVTTQARGQAATTTIATGQGAQVTTWTQNGRGATVVAGRAQGSRPARATTVTAQGRTWSVNGRAATTVAGQSTAWAPTVTVQPQGGDPIYVVDGTVVSGNEQRAWAVTPGRGGQATTVTTWNGDGTVRGQAWSGGASTTIAGWDGATTRDREGYAYTTGDTQGRIAALREMARNAPPEAAARGLGRLAFSEDDEEVQSAAVKELAKLRTRAAQAQLQRIARDHPSRAIRAQASAALR